jgi:asparagine synthase (glutamine-hydrolysing)
MCGIFFYTCGVPEGRGDALLRAMQALDARGPEGMRVRTLEGYGTLGFTRLAINGLNELAMQPMTQEDRTWICNGEIYNWRELAAQHDVRIETGSDCEVLGGMYEKFCHSGISLEGFFKELDGVFAMVLVDEGRQQIIVARDPYGVRPLYKGTSFSGYATFPVFASEMKALTPFCEDIQPFPPGHYQVIHMLGANNFRMDPPKPYHMIPFVKQPYYTDAPVAAAAAIKEALTMAVQKRVYNTSREIGCLLSGGLDSSLIAALVSKELRKMGASPLRTYSIGMEQSSDLLHARLVAEHIGSVHTEVFVTAEDLFAAVPEVIRAIESYDTTTVRASVPNYLLAKKIRQTSDCKVIFNGDGSDEVFGSYLYFNAAPSDAAFEDECRRLLTDIHMFDVLRSDRSISSNGLEPRTPYLDKQFVATALAMPTELRRPTVGGLCEKWLLRKAFDDGTLPAKVLWRRKEAFSDGVSGEKSWYQSAKEMANEALGFGWERDHPSSKTAEQAYYKWCYVQAFGTVGIHTNVPYFWMPRWTPGATDPSARTLALY